MNEKPIIFINGMMKTGTTLLLNLFDGHKDIITFPDETVFEVLYEKTNKSLFDHFIENNNCRLFRKVYGLSKHPRQSSSFDKIFNDDFVHKNIDYKLFKNNFQKLNQVHKSSLFINKFLNSFAESLKLNDQDISKKKYFLFKSPSFSNPSTNDFLTRQIKDILTISRESKIIIPLRDPKSLIKSLIAHEIRVHKKKFHFFNKIFFILKISYEIECTLKEYSRIKDNIFFLKYEDLVNDNKKELKKILSFLEIDYDKSLEYTTYFNQKISSETAPLNVQDVSIVPSDKLSFHTMNFSKVDEYFLSLFDVYELNFLLKEHPLRDVYDYKPRNKNQNIYLRKFLSGFLKFY